jgi:diaminopimelate epimerase
VVENLRITKMHGAGNDFVMADGKDVPQAQRAGLSAALCRRRTSVGADGLILVTRLSASATEVDFYNPDGSRAEMCGNGSRCAARFAVESLGVSRQHTMETVSGNLEASYAGPESIAVVMPAPLDLQLSHATVDGIELHRITVGVPHTVVFTGDISAWDDDRMRAFGSKLRYDRDLYPAGTNLNVAGRSGNDGWRVRTYERGVEDITLACGTGNTATAFIASELGLATFPFRSTVDGGNLTIDCRDGHYWLIGPARTVMTGEIHREALLGD